MRRAAALVLALAGCAAFLAAAAADPDIPAPAGYVNDRAGVMGEWAGKTEALCREIERSTGAQVAVLTVKTTEGMAPQQYAQLVFDRWKIGRKGKDDGVLVLVAVTDRKLWIATGYGVEGVLPDGKVGEIRDRHMVPAFRAGQYGEGIHRGVEAIGNVLRGGPDAPAAPAPSGGESRRRSWLERNLFPLSFAAILLFLLVRLVARVVGFFRGIAGGGVRRTGRYRSGGFWGGGFGGGMSGGGGAGGGW